MNGLVEPVKVEERPILARLNGITNLKLGNGLSLWEQRICDSLLEVDFNWKKCVEVVKGKYGREFNPRQIERLVRGNRSGTLSGRPHLIEYLQKKVCEKSQLEGFDITSVKLEALRIYNGKEVNEVQLKALEMIKDLELRKVGKDVGPKTAIQINFTERTSC